jgi:hypothetical protein
MPCQITQVLVIQFINKMFDIRLVQVPIHSRLNLSIIKSFIFSGTAAQRGPWPHRSRDLVISHNDAPQSVGLPWTSDQLVAETST